MKVLLLEKNIKLIKNELNYLKHKSQKKDCQDTHQDTHQDTYQDTHQDRILKFCEEPRKTKGIMTYIIDYFT